MGNSHTKQSRSGDDPDATSESWSHRSDDRTRADTGRSRNRMSRADLGGFLNLPSSSRARDRQAFAPERHETRQERDARRLERDHAARVKERERSMREEHVDGGFLVTLGTYTGPEDFSKPVVRQLQIERKLAPFWRGLNDWSESWAKHQLVAAARNLPIPAADAPPDPDLIPQQPTTQLISSQNLNKLTVPMGSRTQSAASYRSNHASSSAAFSASSNGTIKGLTLRPRAKALAAALSVNYRNGSSTDLVPREMNLPHDPFVNGQPIEVYLYKNASECPICFLSYPSYLNRTKCCDQPICSECFVQIRRADPHLPEHHPDGEARDPRQELNPEDPPEMLISEPSACPYCQQPEFGVTYVSPSFRRVLVYSASTCNLVTSTAMSSHSSLNSTLPTTTTQQQERRRTHSLSATALNVITDRVRPDWATKLAAARAHQARRAAAATALHTATFLMGGNDQRPMMRHSRFGRGSGAGIGANSSAYEGPDSVISRADNAHYGDHGSLHPDHSQRNRMEELEEMMFMEAVRLSLAAEEERKRKEEKTLRKEAKKREQAERKAQKKQGKDPYGAGPSSASGSSLSLGYSPRKGDSASRNAIPENSVQDSLLPTETDGPAPLQPDVNDKGKGVSRNLRPQSASGAPAPTLLATEATSSRRKDLSRQLSNASSMGSSDADGPTPPFKGMEATESGRMTVLSEDRGETPGQDNADEPLYNFRSLAELVGVDIDDGVVRIDDPSPS